MKIAKLLLGEFAGLPMTALHERLDAIPLEDELHGAVGPGAAKTGDGITIGAIKNRNELLELKPIHAAQGLGQPLHPGDYGRVPRSNLRRRELSWRGRPELRRRYGYLIDQEADETRYGEACRPCRRSPQRGDKIQGKAEHARHLWDSLHHGLTLRFSGHPSKLPTSPKKKAGCLPQARSGSHFLVDF